MVALILSSPTFVRGSPIAQCKRKVFRTTAKHSVECRGGNALHERAQTRREIMMNSVGGLFLGSLFSFSGTRPSNLGLKDYGQFKSLGLCPPTPNCISTAEEANDVRHYVPQWDYDARKTNKTQAEAMAELRAAVESCTEGRFTPTIIKQTDNYLNAEFQSAIFGFVDDVEFYFPGNGSTYVEYRSASRLGESDGDANRKRIRGILRSRFKVPKWQALRKALQPSGWASIGY